MSHDQQFKSIPFDSHWNQKMKIIETNFLSLLSNYNNQILKKKL